MCNPLTMKCPYPTGSTLLTTYDPFDNAIHIRLQRPGSMPQPITDTDAAGTFTNQKIRESLEWMEIGLQEHAEDYKLTEADIKAVIQAAKDAYLPSPNREVTINGFKITIKLVGELGYFDIVVDGRNYTDWKAKDAFPYLMRLSVLDALRAIPQSEAYNRQLLQAFRAL